ncbi:hypothetical protein JYU34_003829 [Plutella xylostella]|uniref:Uncharacterized protein n=1 Tax=Plutella xylostella TaxID=51655 RepID=A0ABQ7R0Z7_PLUXY|nr:hypothetical protein JYU34_003829 [Plutella xylostella]
MDIVLICVRSTSVGGGPAAAMARRGDCAGGARPLVGAATCPAPPAPPAAPLFTSHTLTTHSCGL